LLTEVSTPNGAVENGDESVSAEKGDQAAKADLRQHQKAFGSTGTPSESCEAGGEGQPCWSESKT